MSERLAPYSREVGTAAPFPELPLVRETAPTREQLFSRFWYDTVLGVPQPPDNPLVTAPDNTERIALLDSSLRARLRQLAGELGVNMLEGHIVELPGEAMRRYAQPYLAEDNNLLDPAAKKGIEENLAQLETREKSPVNAMEMELMKHKKEEIYLNIIRSQLGSMAQQAFSFFPSQAAKNRTLDCTLATALGKEIAQKAGFNVEVVSAPGHLFLALPGEEDAFTVYDMVNKHVPPIAARRGNRLFEHSTLVKEDDLENKQTPYRFFLIEGPFAAVEAILGNTEHYLEHEDAYNTELGLSAFPLEDKVIFETLRRTYPEHFIRTVRSEFFGVAPDYLGSSVWKDEKKRIDEWFMAHEPKDEEESGVQPAKESEAGAATEPMPVYMPPVHRENAIKQVWRWVRNAMKRLWGWITDDP